jgi:cold shock protein
MEEERFTGMVKWFSTEKGYGFIKVRNPRQDVFVQLKAVQRSGLTTLESGDWVEFSLVQGKKGPKALHLRKIPLPSQPLPEGGIPELPSEARMENASEP